LPELDGFHFLFIHYTHSITSIKESADQVTLYPLCTDSPNGQDIITLALHGVFAVPRPYSSKEKKKYTSLPSQLAKDSELATHSVNKWISVFYIDLINKGFPARLPEL